MKRRIAHFALIIDDYDRAIEYYTTKLNFLLKEDTFLDEKKRWVLITPSDDSETSILLAKASNTEQINYIGNQTGGRVFLFLHTDDFERDYSDLLAKEVKIVREPVIEKWGKVLVFEDQYGNLWDLIQPSNN